MTNYHRIDVLFFERPLVDLKKFAFKIASVIKSKDEKIKLGAVCIELPGKGDGNKIDYFYHRSQIKDIDEFLRNSKVRIIVFTQSRIPDLEFILHAKRLNIKTIMLQEGVMFDGMNINDISKDNLIAILGYLPKVAEYLNIVRHMCKYDGKCFIKIIKEILKKKRNITIILANAFSNHLICDYVLTMGEYWDDYYIDKHGYKKEQIKLIGDHDLDEFIPQNNNEAAICYIANALLEDGAIKKKDFDKFITLLAEAIDKNTKLYVKLHPRSNRSFYDVLNNHNVEFIRDGTLPSVNVYIGHRSALLGRALYESDSLIIWRFSNEEFSFYEQFALATCTDSDSFINAVHGIDITMHTNRQLDKISRVYWNNPDGSMNAAGKYIQSYLINGSI